MKMTLKILSRCMILTLQEQLGLYPYIGKIFNAFIFENMLATRIDTTSDPTQSLIATGFKNAIHYPPGNPQLISNNTEAINSLVYQLHQRKGTFVAESRLIYVQKLQANKLIELIDKEYNLN
jgi:hypothetical protein